MTVVVPKSTIDLIKPSKENYTFKRGIIENIEEIRNNDKDLIFNTRCSNDLYSRLLMTEFCCFFYGIVSLLICVLMHYHRPEVTELFYWDKLDFFHILCTILLVICIYIKYDVTIQWKISVNQLTKDDCMHTTGMWKDMMFEMIICSISPLPVFEGLRYYEYSPTYDVTISYKINDILLTYMFIRIYLFIRLILFMFDYMTPRTQRACAIHGCEFSTSFAMKSLIQENPFTFIYVGLMLTIIIFGFQLMIYEGPISEASGQDFTLMKNTMWCMLITMTGVGYGDYFPKTFFGRCVGCLISFWGMFLISFIVVAVSNNLKFTK